MNIKIVSPKLKKNVKTSQQTLKDVGPARVSVQYTG